MSLELHVERRGETENGKALNIGDVVIYCGHVPGGMVAIQFKDGVKDIAHPACFKELIGRR